MRKLRTALLAAIITAAAFTVTAATAQADQPFWMYDSPSGGNICYPFCADTGFEGDFRLHTNQGAYLETCDIEFSLNVDQLGLLEFQDPSISGCGQVWVEPCEDQPWYGEARLKDNDEIWVEVLICIVGGAGVEDTEQFTLRITEPNYLGTWNQNSLSPTGGPGRIEGMHIENTYSADNAYVIPE